MPILLQIAILSIIVFIILLASAIGLCLKWLLTGRRPFKTHACAMHCKRPDKRCICDMKE